jgi:D-glycero-alpha-D-manno-heptose-7-phosphate kinase
MIITKTPLRISLMGGGTDLPSFYKDNSYGAVVSCTIDKFLYVSLKKQNELFDEKFRLNYYLTENINTIDEIKNPVIRECFRELNIDDYLYISTIADAPSSTGLGSSSAFCVGLLKALYKYRNQEISNAAIAEQASDIEIKNLNLSLGKQDHYSAVYGGLNYFKFLNNDKVLISKLDFNSELFNKIKQNLLIFWTGIQRSAETILKDQSSNINKNIEKLIELRNLTDNFCEKLIYNDNTFDFGGILDETWNIKKSFSNKITNSLINEGYSIALKSGAKGGKICGAGGGGFLMIISQPEFHESISTELNKIGLKKYNLKFVEEASKVYEIN